ncbi:hypothetical protein [Schaalia hyovaginalis]|uniref:hypothetical protein n=1 Tax=Schaalia hyovaginalis TaxID=29316 RepID=UPI002A74A43C|nr:hypothetical protein [Schaalia hyovaginalis]MDY2669769.1 hypothetical protein [Schaalia hyovaginalis]
MTTTTKKKTPSAAELARREAQSAADKGESQPITVGLWGVDMTIPQERFNDLSYTANLLRMDDETLDTPVRTKAAVSVAMHMCGGQFDEVVAAYRRAHEGAAPISACGEIVQEIFTQLNPESQAS